MHWLILAAYAALNLFALPYTWTFTGVSIAVALAWAGIAAGRARPVAARP